MKRRKSSGKGIVCMLMALTVIVVILTIGICQNDGYLTQLQAVALGTSYVNAGSSVVSLNQGDASYIANGDERASNTKTDVLIQMPNTVSLVNRCGENFIYDSNNSTVICKAVYPVGAEGIWGNVATAKVGNILHCGIACHNADDVELSKIAVDVSVTENLRLVDFDERCSVTAVGSICGNSTAKSYFVEFDVEVVSVPPTGSIDYIYATVNSETENAAIILD